MTRINCVPVTELVDKHLVAEYRELPRVFSLARPCSVPETYRLGTGHVLFFYDKLGWLRDRYHELCAEMRRRGFTVNYPEPPVSEHLGLYGGWTPTERDMEINRARISERLRQMEEA